MTFTLRETFQSDDSEAVQLRENAQISKLGAENETVEDRSF